MTDDKKPDGQPRQCWRKPTRRAFVAMLTAAAAALVVKPAPEPPKLKTRWIGHC